jgi:hypothetical protein
MGDGAWPPDAAQSEAYAPKEKAADELLTSLAAAGVNKKAT